MRSRLNNEVSIRYKLQSIELLNLLQSENIFSDDHTNVGSKEKTNIMPHKLQQAINRGRDVVHFMPSMLLKTFGFLWRKTEAYLEKTPNMLT